MFVLRILRAIGSLTATSVLWRSDRMESNLRQLRHDLRGRANTLLLCTSALPHASDRDEKLEYLDEILIASDNLVELLDRLETMPEHYAGSTQTDELHLHEHGTPGER
jgi:hypothetical protein